jgi:uncharacterized protein YjbJ (UPF0337 family)
MSNPFERDRDYDHYDKDLGTCGTENKAGGTMDKVTGKVEEVAGDLTGNERLKAKDEAKRGVGEAENRVDNAAGDLTS